MGPAIRFQEGSLHFRYQVPFATFGDKLNVQVGSTHDDINHLDGAPGTYPTWEVRKIIDSKYVSSQEG